MSTLKSDQNFSNHSLCTDNNFASSRLKTDGNACEETSKKHYIYRPHQEKETQPKKQDDFTCNYVPKSLSTVLQKDSTPPQPVKVAHPVIEQKPLQQIKKASVMSLQEMASAILLKLTIILHDNSLYYYNGRCYQLIEDGEDLLALVRAKISHDAFASVSLKRFPDLFTYMRTDERLIPDSYQKKIRKAVYYVSFQNGILDLKEMKLYPHSPKYLTFYSLDAGWTNKPNPLCFRQFLQTISGGNEQITNRIKESLGYLLSPLNEGKCFFVMGNAQNSGKSTLGMFLQRVLGQKLVTTKSVQQLSERFSLGNIQGKLLNLSMDLPNGKLNAATVSIIKQITGGDTITVERKYDKQREVAHCRMRFLFASNYPVTIPKNDDNDAFWDRMIVIPFLYSIKRTDADVDFLEKLLKEKDDIISTCMIALGKVIHNHYTFSHCQAAEELKHFWRYQEYDNTRSISVFVEQYLDITRNPADELYLQKLYQQYCSFCDDYELSAATYHSFSSWLFSNIDGCCKKRIHKTGTNPQAGLTGLRMKTREADELPL